MPEGSGGALGKRQVEVGKGIRPPISQQLPWTLPRPWRHRGKRGAPEGKAAAQQGQGQRGRGQREGPRSAQRLPKVRKMALCPEQEGAPALGMPKKRKRKLPSLPQKSVSSRAAGATRRLFTWGRQKQAPPHRALKTSGGTGSQPPWPVSVKTPKRHPRDGCAGRSSCLSVSSACPPVEALLCTCFSCGCSALKGVRSPLMDSGVTQSHTLPGCHLWPSQLQTLTL